MLINFPMRHRSKQNMHKQRLLLASLLVFVAAAAEAGLPRLSRIVPTGAQRGTTVEVTLQGKFLEKPEEVLLY